MQTNLEKLASVVRGHKTFIQTHNYPDADALSSAFGLQYLLQTQGIDTAIGYVGKIDKVNTAQMVRLLGIKAIDMTHGSPLKQEDYIVIIDAQKHNSNIRDVIGDEVACIDHHPITGTYEYLFSDIRPDVGACASVITDYFIQNSIEVPENVATALLYGIKMDTQFLCRGVTQFDMDMYHYLFSRSNRDIIGQLLINTMEMRDLVGYAQSIDTIEIYDKVGISRIDGFCPDALIASISDFVLSLKEVDVSIVYNIRPEGVKFSVRSEIAQCDAGVLVREALAGLGTGGGHATMAGGYIEGSDFGDDFSDVLRDRFLGAV